MLRTRLPVFVAAMLVLGADKPKKDETAKDVARFQGTWVLVSLESNGESVAAEDLKGRKLIIKGDESVMMEGDKVFSRSTQKLTAGKKFPQLDITQTDGPEKGKVTRGIYQLDKDDLTVCYTYPGDGRPDEFKAGKDSGRILLKFRREKP